MTDQERTDAAAGIATKIARLINAQVAELAKTPEMNVEASVIVTFKIKQGDSVMGQYSSTVATFL